MLGTYPLILPKDHVIHDRVNQPLAQQLIQYLLYFPESQVLKQLHCFHRSSGNTLFPPHGFVLLFDTTPRSLSRRIPGQGSQSTCLQHTGIIGIPPPPGSPEAALIAWSPAKGAVTGRKYHCQLSGAMAIQPCLWLIESQVCTALALRCIAHPWTGSCPAGSLRAPLTSLSFLTTGQPM